MESSVQEKAQCSQSAERVLNEFSVSVSGGFRR